MRSLETLGLVLVITAACTRAPGGLREKVERGEQKENLNLLAAHCTAWSGATPLTIHALVEVEDFGPATGGKLNVEWAFGDGQTSLEERVRPGVPRAMPGKYRLDFKTQHKYSKAGSYDLAATVKNGSRSATCSTQIILLEPGVVMPHPQG
jgi:hypothetical protein